VWILAPRKALNRMSGNAKERAGARLEMRISCLTEVNEGVGMRWREVTQRH
jgi:hypothetical protein